MPDVNIHVHPKEEDRDKVNILTCNWCKEMHAVTPEYKQEALARGAKRIAEMKAEYPEDVSPDITPEDTWTCGRCFVFLMHLPADTKTECHEHAVPKNRPYPQTKGESHGT